MFSKVFVWSLKFYIKKEWDSLYFGYFLKVVHADVVENGYLWTKLRKLKKIRIFQFDGGVIRLKTSMHE